MTPRKMASDLKIPWHHLAHFWYAKFGHSKLRLVLVFPSPIGRTETVQFVQRQPPEAAVTGLALRPQAFPDEVWREDSTTSDVGNCNTRPELRISRCYTLVVLYGGRAPRQFRSRKGFSWPKPTLLFPPQMDRDQRKANSDMLMFPSKAFSAICRGGQRYGGCKGTGTPMSVIEPVLDARPLDQCTLRPIVKELRVPLDDVPQALCATEQIAAHNRDGLQRAHTASNTATNPTALRCHIQSPSQTQSIWHGLARHIPSWGWVGGQPTQSTPRRSPK